MTVDDIRKPSGFPGGAPHDELVTRTFSEISATRIEWLWANRLPIGKFCLLIGDPSGGKTTIALDVAARLSRGADWPDGAASVQGETLIVSSEDDAADTVKPRLLAAGARAPAVHWLAGFAGKGPWNLGEIEALDRFLGEHGAVRLVLIDPITAYLPGAVDDNKNSQIRGVLGPLAATAAARRVCVLGISHLRKSEGAALYRALGSIAYVAASRAAWAVARDPENRDRRLLLPLKSNLGPDVGGLAFSIESVPVEIDGVTTWQPRVAWECGAVTTSADEAFARGDPGEAPSRSEAQEFLREELRDGPVAAKQIERDARDAGLPWITVKRAKRRLGVTTQKRGMSGAWFWTLPGSEGPNAAEGDHDSGHKNNDPLRYPSSPFDTLRGTEKEPRDEDDAVAI